MRNGGDAAGPVGVGGQGFAEGEAEEGGREGWWVGEGGGGGGEEPDGGGGAELRDFGVDDGEGGCGWVWGVGEWVETVRGEGGDC